MATFAVRRAATSTLIPLLKSGACNFPSVQSQECFAKLLRHTKADNTLKRLFSMSAAALQKTDLDADELPSLNHKITPNSSNIHDVSNLDRVEKCVNQITLLGRIGSDPQLRGTEANPVLLFSLATHENFRSDTGTLQQKTMWHRVAIFKVGLRETIFKYARKGQRVYLTGTVSYSNVKDTETSILRTVTTIIADDIIMLAGPLTPTAPKPIV